MIEKIVFNTINKYKMIQQGDTVVVALSGGADSVALFHFLYTHKSDLGISLEAAHFEHGIRGEESLRDAEFVNDLCKQFDIKLHIGHGDISNKKRPSGIGEEAFARMLRYEFFEAVLNQSNKKVATAHSLSDNAETVLFRIARGSGPKGMSGIPPVRGSFIRPFIDITRKQIEGYCLQNNLKYVTDSTNLSEDYSRNIIRKHVLPNLEKARPGAQHSISRLAQDMLELDGWIHKLAEDLIKESGTSETGYDCSILSSAPKPLLLYAIAILAGASADRAALDRIISIIEGDVPATQISGETRVYVHRGRLWFVTEKQKPCTKSDKIWHMPLQHGLNKLPGGYMLEVLLASSRQEIENYIQEKNIDYYFVADYDKIDKCALLRNRLSGDKYSQPGRKCSKSVKKWMNEQGIPAHLRDELPMFTLDNTVLWIWNSDFAQSVKPDKDTTKYLVFVQL